MRRSYYAKYQTCFGFKELYRCFKRYAIIDIDEYERTQAKIKIMSKLADAEQAAKKDGWIDATDVKKILGVE